MVLCDSCLASLTPPLDTPYFFVSSLYSFKDEKVKKIIHAIKFFHRRDLVDPLSKNLVTLLPNDDKKWVIIPIPAHIFRRMERGYNQTLLIAQTLHRESAVPIEAHALKKIKHTKRQALAHGRKERLGRQAGTFLVTEDVKGWNIILVDDVITTGATLSEARRVLLASGANEVLAVTIAH